MIVNIRKNHHDKGTKQNPRCLNFEVMETIPIFTKASYVRGFKHKKKTNNRKHDR